MSHGVAKLYCEVSETESLNGFKKKWGSACEFLCQWLLNMIIWVKYVPKKCYKNFLIIKLHNNRCAKKKELFSKCHLRHGAGDRIVSWMSLPSAWIGLEALCCFLLQPVWHFSWLVCIMVMVCIGQHRNLTLECFTCQAERGINFYSG